MKIQYICIIGATGMLGKPVTKQLVRAGFNITVISRDSEKAKSKLKGLNLPIREADVRDVQSLVDAFSGQDAVYLNLSTSPYEQASAFKIESDGIANIIAAAGLCGLHRITYLSSLVIDYKGISNWLFDVKRDAVRQLRSSRIPVTVFYASNFFENLPKLLMKRNRILLAGNQKTKSWWIGAEDYGKQVARSFTLPQEGLTGYAVQGPEPMSFEEAAEVFITNYGARHLKKLKVPLWVVRATGLISARVACQYRIVYAINRYDEQFDAEETWNCLGRPELTLEEYAKQLSVV